MDNYKPIVQGVYSRNEAKARLFPVYNQGRHLCVDVPAESFTISCILPDGQAVTFSFVPRPDQILPSNVGHQCVDILHHDTVNKTENGNPVQQVSILGEGPTLYSARDVADHSPPTLTVLKIPKL